MVQNEFFTIHYKELQSTQTEAKSLIDRGEKGFGTVVYTPAQTKGVGRYSKCWESNKGDLAATLILKPKREEYEQLAYVAAVAVGESILSYAHQSNSFELQYKWVNDVIVNGRKISGLLLERYKHNLLLLGMGINILPKMNIKELNAVGMHELNICIDYKSFLKILLKNFSYFYDLWERMGFSEIRNIWLRRVFGLNKQVKVNLPGDASLSGLFRSIDPSGKMKLEVKNGDIKLINAGETFF